MWWMYGGTALALVVAVILGGGLYWFNKPETRLGLLEQDILHRTEEMQDVASVINKVSLRAGPPPPDLLAINDRFDEGRTHLAAAEDYFRRAKALSQTKQGAKNKKELLSLTHQGHDQLGKAEAIFKGLRKRQRSRAHVRS